MSAGSRETGLPEALRRAEPLLTEAPEPGRLRHGYLDLLDTNSAPPQAANQSTWSSARVSAAYDRFQSLLRKVAPRSGLPASATSLPDGSRALDVGCGPGNLTGDLGRACGPNGVALGVDISAPLLERAAAAENAASTGFVRADARALPFHDGSFHVVTSIANVHNVPEPERALREFVRVLAPGGRLFVLTLVEGGRTEKVLDVLGKRFDVTGLHPDRTAKLLHSEGIATVHTRPGGSLLRIEAAKA